MFLLQKISFIAIIYFRNYKPKTLNNLKFRKSNQSKMLKV